LIEGVWGSSFRTDDVVTKAIRELRQIFDDKGGRNSEYIQTISKLGYRLTASIKALPQEHSPALLVPEDIIGRPASGRGGVHKHPLNSRFLSQSLLVAGSLVVIGIVAALVFQLRPTRLSEKESTLPNALRDQIALHTLPFTSAPGAEEGPVVSPNGQWVVYQFSAPGPDVEPATWIKPVQGSEARPLHADARGAEVGGAWSSDSKQIVFSRFTQNRCALVIAEPANGTETIVSECNDAIFGFPDFTPGDQSIMLVEPGPRGDAILRRVAIGDGARSDIALSQHDGPLLEAHFAPDGKHLVVRRGDAQSSELFLEEPQTGTFRALTALSARLQGYAWLDNRHIVFSSDHAGPRSLWLLDTSTGGIEPLGGMGASYPSVSQKTHVLVFQRADQRWSLIRSPLRPDAAEEVIHRSTHSETYPILSPNEHRLAFVSDRDGTPQVFVANSENTARALTHLNDADVRLYQWSPDERRLLYGIRKSGGRGQLFSVSVLDGSTRPESDGALDVRSGAYVPERPGALFLEIADHSESAIVQFDAATHASTPIVSDAARPQVSDDGNFVLYVCQHGHALCRWKRRDRSVNVLQTGIYPWNADGWTVVQKSLYWNAFPTGESPGLFMRPIDGEALPKRVRTTNGELGVNGVAIDEAAGVYLSSRAKQNESDLYLVHGW